MNLYVPSRDTTQLVQKMRGLIRIAAEWDGGWPGDLSAWGANADLALDELEAALALTETTGCCWYPESATASAPELLGEPPTEVNND